MSTSAYLPRSPGAESAGASSPRKAFAARGLLAAVAVYALWAGLTFLLEGRTHLIDRFLFSKGIAAAHKLRRGPASLAGAAAFVIYQLVFVVFNR